MIHNDPRLLDSVLDNGVSTHIIYPLKYIVYTGNIATGLRIYGPFDDNENALDWVKTNVALGTVFSTAPMFDVRDNG